MCVYLFSGEKEESLALCNNIDGPRGHYAQWNKSDRKRQRLYDSLKSEIKKIKNKKIKQTNKKTSQKGKISRTGWWLPEVEGESGRNG